MSRLPPSRVSTCRRSSHAHWGEIGAKRLTTLSLTFTRSGGGEKSPTTMKARHLEPLCKQSVLEWRGCLKMTALHQQNATLLLSLCLSLALSLSRHVSNLLPRSSSLPDLVLLHALVQDIWPVLKQGASVLASSWQLKWLRLCRFHRLGRLGSREAGVKGEKAAHSVGYEQETGNEWSGFEGRSG